MLADYTMGDRIAQQSFLQDTYAITAPAPAASILHVAQPLQIKNWLGWVGSVQPRIIDTSVLGTIHFYILLAGVEVSCQTNVITSSNYQIN
jgi:hypothetical protein